MYYYAFVDPVSKVCISVHECDTPYYDGNQHYIPIDFYDESLLIRKKYINGEWVDSLPHEAQREEAKYIGIDGVWLNERIYDIDAQIANRITADDFDPVFNYFNEMIIATQEALGTKADIEHTHSAYSLTNHTHDGYVNTTDFNTLELEVDGKANAVHSHTASAVGAIATGDVATVSEVETYLGI